MPSLSKSVWTDDDFDVMGWHDNSVHAWGWEPWDPDRPGENVLVLDLDYIVEWVHPTEAGGVFSFWICPATLVFANATDLKFDLEEQGGIAMEIDTITWTPEAAPSGASGYRKWAIEGHNFTFEFSGRGFEQYLRRPPVHAGSQSLSLAERGGLSFDRRGFAAIP